jgi:hypothetical protein
MKRESRTLSIHSISFSKDVANVDTFSSNTSNTFTPWIIPGLLSTVTPDCLQAHSQL